MPCLLYSYLPVVREQAGALLQLVHQEDSLGMLLLPPDAAGLLRFFVVWCCGRSLKCHLSGLAPNLVMAHAAMLESDPVMKALPWNPDPDLQRCAGITDVVLDKTGTLTAGRLRMVDVQPFRCDAAGSEPACVTCTQQCPISSARSSDSAWTAWLEFALVPGPCSTWHSGPVTSIALAGNTLVTGSADKCALYAT